MDDKNKLSDDGKSCGRSHSFSVKLQSLDSVRLDTYLSDFLHSSRSQVESLIKKGLVIHNHKVAKKGGIKLEDMDTIEVLKPFVEIKEINREIDFDIEIIYEDENLLILNKPPHLIIHDAPSHKQITLVDWLKSRGFKLSTLSGEERCGIVHRLDKDTSGIIVVAKDNTTHANLADQLKTRSMGRYYLAIILGRLKESVQVECYLGRNPKNRLKICKLDEKKYPNARYAKTIFTPLLDSVNDPELQIIGAQLFTGRTHQIRAHLESISRQIVSDPLYGYDNTNLASKPSRIMLHSYILYLLHPRINAPLVFKAAIFHDMLEYALRNFDKDCLNGLLDKDPRTFFSF